MRLGRRSPDAVNGGATRSGRPDGRDRPRLGLLIAGAAGGGVAVALLVGGWAGYGLGAAAAVVAFLVLRRLEPAATRTLRLRAVADLPLAADLLAATLRAGAPVDRAAAAVAEALGGPLAVHLGRVARSLRLGAPPDEAWSYLTPVPGTERLVAAAIRSSASGAALAGALTRLADDLRADRAIAAQVAAHRAGVLVVLPLGLCFLPAFVLAGLVPVIIAVLSDLL
ncbi:type II secretion system F family protein [Catenuloplanes japonicus]|uniref:type II secretion system F family protein n=1 Tax=Catenuloplanes japonicus TaxID=33876 RepID=UPI0038BBF15A